MEVTPFTPLKLLRHRDKIEAMLAGEMIYPISVEVDLSNTCPHDCPFCSFGTSESQGYRQQNWVQLPTTRAVRLMSELAEVGVHSVTFTGGGEPLVHREAAAIFEAAVSNLLQFGVVTNGFMLRNGVARILAEHARFIRVSLDAGSAETHQIVHRPKTPQFHQIVANLAHVRALAGSRDLTLGASFCVMDANYKEIYAAAKFVKEAGGNYLEVRPTFPTEWRGDGWGLALSPENIESAKVELAHAKAHLDGESFRIIGLIDRFDKLGAPTKDYDQCRIGPLVTVIGADGRLWHCCVQRGQDFFNIASISSKSFKEAWADAHARRMHEAIDLSKCPRCRHDNYNEIIAKTFARDDMHAAFL